LKKLLLFDVDGVLRDSEQAAHRGYRAALGEIGHGLNSTSRRSWRLRGHIEFSSRTVLLLALHALEKEGISLRKLQRRLDWKVRLLKLVNKSRLSEQQIKKMNEAFSKSFASESIATVHDAIAALHTFKRKGFRMAILSDGHSGPIEKWLRENRVRKLFEVVLGSDQVNRVKPAPDGILKASKLLGVRPADIVYIGDTPADVLAAKAAGSYSVAVTTGMSTKRILASAKPHILINSLGELVMALEQGSFAAS